MQQSYFIVVLAHSLHGRLRRVQVPQRVVYLVLGFALLGCVSMFGFVSSYVRMVWKVANYNSLRQEVQTLRTRYENLQRVADQTHDQLATLQLFATQVSVAYGIKEKLEGPADISGEGRLVPSFHESLEEYNFLRSANLTRLRPFMARWRLNVRPSIWPVEGRLQGAWGMRIDPFSGEGSFHKGVDICAPYGSAVKATADGLVVQAGYMSGYGRLVVIDHGQGMQTWYAHLSRISVIAGQEIRRGEVIGGVGTSGRVTAPHLHYEVRLAGNPVNPFNYLRSAMAANPKKDLPF
jgi:murein DD-endopeptidase MepM/ murein hydrolase activator NlpD